MDDITKYLRKCPKSIDHELIEWIMDFALEGNPSAQCDLGFMYKKGLGVTLDYLKAIEWYESSTSAETLVITAWGCGLHWYVMGVFMTGEPSQLSPRVKRDLPQSFLGRAFMTWFNPGPASGYMFAVASYLGAVLLILAAAATTTFTATYLSADSAVVMCGLGLAYVTIYLGIGRLLLSMLARAMKVTVATRLLVHALLLFVGTLVPITVQMTVPGLRHLDYTLLQAPNPFWTLAEATSFRPSYEIWTSLMLLGVAAVIVFVLNLPAIAAEVRQTRIAAPERVVEEDAEQAALLAPAMPTRTNPWDEP